MDVNANQFPVKSIVSTVSMTRNKLNPAKALIVLRGA